MKTKVIKRVIAFALATLIILGTLGYFFSMVAWAAEKDITLGAGSTNDFQNVKYEITKPTGKIKVTDQVDITIKFETTTDIVANSIDGGSVDIDTNGSAFEGPNGYTHTLVRSPSSNNYTVSFGNLNYKGGANQGKLAFIVKKDATEKKVILDLSSECDTGNSGGTTTPPITDTPSPSASTMTYTLQKVYSGDKVYFTPGGAAPEIHRNYLADVNVQFVLPGVKQSDVLGNSAKIQINIDRGSFRFAQGATCTVTKAVEIQNADGNVTGVVVHATLTGLRYTGSGNSLEITVQNKDDNLAYIFQQFSSSVDSCVPYVAPTPEPDDDKPDYSDMQMATPYVIVSNYSYGGTVTAGQTFPLSIPLYNTSRNIDVTNMMVTITMPEALMLTSSSNTFYIDHLDTESSVSQTVQVTAKVNAAPQSHNIDISMKYQYIDDHLVSRRDNSTQETISIPVVQIDRFQVTGVDAPAEAYLGEENYLTVNFVNKGRSDVYNLSAEISGDIQNPGQQQNLGNLTSGSTGSAEFTILPNGEGVCNGEIKIIYEDTNMEEKTATILWSTTVVDPSAGMEFPGGMGDFDPGMMDDPSLMDEGEKKPSWPFIAGGVAVAALVVGLLVRRHILKKRSEEEDANL